MNLPQNTIINQQDRLEEQIQKLDHYCRFLQIKKWDREDIIQETLLKALEKYEEQNITPALLKRIAYNQWVDRIRKNKKQVILQENMNLKESRALDNLLLLAEHFSQSLTSKQAIVYILSEGFHYRLKEIADMLDTSETAVKGILFRARNRLNNKTLKEIVSTNGEEQKQLFTVIYETMKEEDPMILIQAIPIKVPSGKIQIHEPKCMQSMYVAA